MTKSELIKVLGRQKDIANLLGLSKARVSQMPEDLPQGIVDRVVGAAVRAGVYGEIKHLLAGDNDR